MSQDLQVEAVSLSYQLIELRLREFYVVYDGVQPVASDAIDEELYAAEPVVVIPCIAFDPEFGETVEARAPRMDRIMPDANRQTSCALRQPDRAHF
jgi:hypothetical protein